METMKETMMSEQGTYPVNCPVANCTWGTEAMSSEEAEMAFEQHAQAEHWSTGDSEPEQPEDVARTELDRGLELVNHASVMPSGTTAPSVVKTHVQEQAQLHLLSSIATSLYEMKLMAAHIYEVFSHPRQVVLGDKGTCTCEPMVRQDAQGTYIPFDGTEDRIRDDLCPVHGVTVDKEQ